MKNKILDTIKTYLKRLKDINYYLLASAIPMFVNLALNPIFAMHLQPQQYAIIGYYASFSTLFTPFINFYMNHYYMRCYYELGEKDRNDLYQTVVQLLIWVSMLFAFISFLCIVFYRIFFIAKTDMPFWPYSILVFLPPFLSGVFQLQLVRYKMQRLSKNFFYMSVSNHVLSTVLSLLLVVTGCGATGKMVGPILILFVFFVYICWQERRIILSGIDMRIAKDCLLFCAPLVAAAMLGFFSNGFDKIYLERYVSLRDLGLYSVGISVASMVNVFSEAVTSTFTPDIYQSIAERKYTRFIHWVLLKLAIITAVIVPFLLLTPFAIKMLTAGRYMESVGYARIAVLSTLTSSLYYSCSQLTIALKHNYIALLTKVTGSVLCIVMYRIAISKWQTTGAAWSVVASFLIFLACNIFYLSFCVLIRRKQNA